MGWVLSCETGFSEVSMPFCWPEDNIVPCEEWRAWDGPRAVGDPMHVETSFVRNLGDLVRVRRGMPGRFMKGKTER